MPRFDIKSIRQYQFNNAEALRTLCKALDLSTPAPIKLLPPGHNTLTLQLAHYLVEFDLALIALCKVVMKWRSSTIAWNKHYLMGLVAEVLRIACPDRDELATMYREQVDRLTRGMNISPAGSRELYDDEYLTLAEVAHSLLSPFQDIIYMMSRDAQFLADFNEELGLESGTGSRQGFNEGSSAGIRKKMKGMPDGLHGSHQINSVVQMQTELGKEWQDDLMGRLSMLKVGDVIPVRSAESCSDGLTKSLRLLRID